MDKLHLSNLETHGRLSIYVFTQYIFTGQLLYARHDSRNLKIEHAQTPKNIHLGKMYTHNCLNGPKLQTT